MVAFFRAKLVRTFRLVYGPPLEKSFLDLGTLIGLVIATLKLVAIKFSKDHFKTHYIATITMCI